MLIVVEGDSCVGVRRIGDSCLEEAVELIDEENGFLRH